MSNNQVINFNGAYICCQDASMNRLNRRAPNIINMQSQSLTVGRRTLQPIGNQERIVLAQGLSMVKCNTSYAFEYSNKHSGEVIIFIITDSPAYGSFKKLIQRGIVLKDQGLYQAYIQNGVVCVKSENELKVYKQGESNLVPITDPIIDPLDGPDSIIDPIEAPDNVG